MFVALLLVFPFCCKLFRRMACASGVRWCLCRAGLQPASKPLLSVAAGLVSGPQAASKSGSGATPRPGREASPANSILAANYGEEGEADTLAADFQSSLQGRGSLSTAASGVSLTSQGSAALPSDFSQQVELSTREA